MVVKLLLEKGAELEARDDRGRTPLLWAAENGHEAVMKLLVSRDAKLETRDNHGRIELSIATGRGYEAVVGLLLLKNNAKLEASSDCGQTALLWATGSGHETCRQAVAQYHGQARDQGRLALYGRTSLLRAAWRAHCGHQANTR
jgi:ankyrin repeat protein